MRPIRRVICENWGKKDPGSVPGELRPFKKKLFKRAHGLSGASHPPQTKKFTIMTKSNPVAKTAKVSERLCACP